MAGQESTSHPQRLVMLHIFPSFGFGGQQARFAALAKGLGPDAYHQVVALDGDVAARGLLPSDAPVRYRAFDAKKSSLASLSNIAGFRSLLREVRPDILCTYNWGAIEAAIANRAFRRTPHLHFEDGFGPGESPDNQPQRRVLARRAVLRNSAIIVPSRVLERVAIDVWKLPRSRVVYIQNGIDIERFASGPAGRGGESVTIGSVGALRAEKNYLRLINAVAALDDARAIRLEIVGEGPERDALQSVIDACTSEVSMTLPGPTSAPQTAYQRFGIFALSSDTEQAPLSLMEAMAAGLPVVATDVGDIADMVAPENRTFITPLGDDEAYANALTALAKDPALREKLGSANAQKAAQEFSVASMVDAHRALYWSLVKD